MHNTMTTKADSPPMKNKSDFQEIINKGHEAFLEKLRLLNASDSSFAFWLSSAAINLCVNFKDVDLRGNLKHANDLVKVVKEGFEQMKVLSPDLSKDERDRLEYSQAFFADTFEEKSGESKVVKESLKLKETTELTLGNEETKCLICKDILRSGKISMLCS